MGLAVAVGMILTALFLVRSEWEKLQLDTVRYRFRTEKPLACPEKEGDGEPGLRLLFISDLHEYLPARSRPEMILSAIDREKPDAVLIGGDMITVSRHKKHPVPHTETALRLIKRIAEKYPVYYGEGNHESRLRVKDSEAYASYVEALLRMGVRYLADSSVPLTVYSGSPEEKQPAVYRKPMETGITVSGVSLEETFYEPKAGFGLNMRLPEHCLKEKMAVPGEGYRILLLHSPAFLKEAAEEDIDLVLSGHMHGGTVRFPDGSGLMTPQYRFFVKECSGCFTEGNTAMVVTRGLGTHSIRVRLNDLPELTVIDIHGKRTDQLQA